MKISVTNLKTTTLAGLVERLVAISKSGKYAEVENHPLLEIIETHYAQYKNLLGKASFSGKGGGVALANDERGKVFSGLKNYLRGCAGVPLLPNASLAKDLYDIFHQHGKDLGKKSYSDQTILLNRIIEELGKAENQEKLSKLKLEPTFNDLKAKQAAFEKLVSSQTQANAELRQTKSASEIRKDLEKSVRNYLNFIASMEALPEWLPLYSEVKEVVKEIRNS